MIVNKINNFTSFKGIEKAYVYSIPQCITSQYICGLDLKLNDNNTQDLLNYQNLLKKFKTQENATIGLKPNIDYYDKVLNNDNMLIEVGNIRGPRRGFYNIVSLNRWPLSVYGFDEKNPSYTKERAEFGRNAQIDFYTELKNFFENITTRLLSDKKLLLANSRKGFELGLRKEIMDYCPKRLNYYDINEIVKQISAHVKQYCEFALKNTKI
jgi:hypothetical protein